MTNAAYEKRIDALIPAAEREARVLADKARNKDRKAGTLKTIIGADGTVYKWDYFCEYFHKVMNKKARAKGLR